MRALVCSAALVLAACGNAERNPRPESGGSSFEVAGGSGTGGSHAGGKGPGGGTGEISGVSGNSVGDAGANSGGSAGGKVVGGAATMGGSAGGTGGSGATLMGGNAGSSIGGTLDGGERGDGGDAGNAGTGGECRDTYVACGCGCCGGVTPMKRCYYPEDPGYLERIMAEDQQAGASPSCASAGCSAGLEYVCCTSEQAADRDATYEATPLVGDYDRLVISRTEADGPCDSITLVNPKGTRDEFLIETPERWSVESANGRLCSKSGNGSAIGGIGRVEWHGSPCVLDFDFTLFFPTAEGAPEAVKFKAENVPLTEFGSLPCE